MSSDRTMARQIPAGSPDGQGHAASYLATVIGLSQQGLSLPGPTRPIAWFAIRRTCATWRRNNSHRLICRLWATDFRDQIPSSNHGCVSVGQGNDVCADKAYFLHPCPAFVRRELGSIVSLQQHVEAGEQAARFSPRVVNEGFVDNECAVLGQRCMSLLEK